jgi:hypothetical protein
MEEYEAHIISDFFLAHRPIYGALVLQGPLGLILVNKAHYFLVRTSFYFPEARNFNEAENFLSSYKKT